MTFHQIFIAEISTFLHLSCCTISPYQFFYYLILSPYKLSHLITQHLYQCNILPYYLSGCSEASYVDRTEPDYMSAAKKYETSLHITPGSLEKISILNENKQNDYARSKMFKWFGGCKSGIGHKYCAAGRKFLFVP